MTDRHHRRDDQGQADRPGSGTLLGRQWPRKLTSQVPPRPLDGETITGPSSATIAIRKALEWRQLIEEQGIRQADIARQEGITRARVTQVMKLLNLPQDIQERLLDEDPSVANWSIRRAIRATCPPQDAERQMGNQ